MKHILLAIAMLVGGSVQAEDQAALGTLIETSGSFEYDVQRNQVQVDQCTMTLTVWRPYQEVPYDLWSEFTFDMRGVTFDPDRKTDRPFHYIEDFGGRPASIVIFSFAPPFEVRHEKPMYRKPKPPLTPSPRPGDYAYQFKSQFFTIMYGEDAEDTAAIFTQALREYVDTYCNVAS